MGGHILFRLTDDRLIAANTGRPFTYNGLVAIVYGWTSSKGPEPESGMAADRNFESEIAAREAVRELFAKKKSHLSDRHQLASERGQRAQTVQGYAERAILELLQNAVDANRTRPIGYKGVGFRSVLNLTNSPAIHSGHLQVRWSPEIACRALGIDESPDPVLAFPEWCPPSSEIPTGYGTVIILPLSDQAARDHLKKEWDRVSIDPSLLVFIDGVQELIWDVGDGQPKTWFREENDRLVTITEAIGDRSPIRHRWKVHQSDHAKVAVPVDDAGNFMVPRNVPRPVLRCFFPTEDPNPFENVLVHAPFALDNSRKHVDTADARIEVHLTSIAAAFAEAVSARRRVSEILDMLDHNTAIDDVSRDQLDARLSKRVKDEVLKQPLPALCGQALANLRCCPQQEELPYRWRDAKRLDRWEHFKACLAEHRAAGLSGLPVLPAGTENAKREKTLLWLSPGAGLSKTELQQLPWAPVEGDSVPLASNVTPLFETPDEDFAPVPIPAGIEMRFLDRKFRKALSDRLGGDIAMQFLRDVLGVRPFKLLDIVEHALLPVLESGKQECGVVEFLFVLWRRSEEKKKTPKPEFDWKDARRARLVRAIKVKCRNGEECPALDVYAGRDWTDSDFLERCYGSRGNGTFLHAPPTAENERAEWESFYRWLGIGWSPKIIPIIAEKDAKETRRGLEWAGERFAVASVEPKYWNEYCIDSWVKHSIARQLMRRRARLKLDWTIDGDRDVLVIPGAFEVIRSEWACYSSYKESICYCSNNLQRDGDDWKLTANSYLFWLFRNSTWIPARNSSELCSPRDVFLPGEVSHSDRMQGWAFAVGAEVSDSVASALGIRRDWIDVADDDWKRWLAAARAYRPQENIEHRETIRRFYACLLENAKVPDDGAPRFSKSEVWWVERLEERENWKFADVANASGSYLDRPELERLRLRDICVFPARLDGREGRAEKIFGMPPLSRLLQGTPLFDEEQSFEYMQNRIKGRMPYLLAYLGLDRNEQGRAQVRTAIESVRVLAVSHLDVRWSMRKRELATVTESSFAHKDSNEWRLYLVSDLELREAGPEWERLAETILLSCGFRPTEKAANVRDILTYPEVRLPEKLTGLGVAPETVADAMKKASGLRVSAEPRETIADPKQQASALPQSPDPKPARSDETLSVNRETSTSNERPKPPSLEDSNERAKTRGSTQRPHPDEGLDAQEWLRKKLHEYFSGPDYSVSPGEQATEGDQGRTDIVITSRAGNQYLVEVKRIEARKIFWSNLQIETAQRRRGSYFMALLEPASEGEEYLVFWVWDPLTQFVRLKRDIQWTWKDRRSTSGFSESWMPLEPHPTHSADGYKVLVELPQKSLDELDRGIEKLSPKIFGDS